MRWNRLRLKSRICVLHHLFLLCRTSKVRNCVLVCFFFADPSLGTRYYSERRCFASEVFFLEVDFKTQWSSSCKRYFTSPTKIFIYVLQWSPLKHFIIEIKQSFFDEIFAISNGNGIGRDQLLHRELEKPEHSASSHGIVLGYVIALAWLFHLKLGIWGWKFISLVVVF